MIENIFSRFCFFDCINCYMGVAAGLETDTLWKVAGILADDKTTVGFLFSTYKYYNIVANIPEVGVPAVY